MIIPFVMVPELCYTCAFLLTKAGFLPQVINTVTWTAPAFLSGYVATSSAKGIIVQFMLAWGSSRRMESTD